MKLDKENKIPYYHQIYCDLKNLINNGTLKKGELIPSEKELCNNYKVSRSTIRLALRELEVSELIRRERGRGTFIENTIETKFLQNFSSTVDELHNKGVPTTTKILDEKIILPDKRIATQLGISTKEKVTFIKRLILSEDNPLYLTKAYYPYDIFGKINIGLITSKSFTRIIKEDFNINVLYIKRIIEPEVPNKELITDLNIDDGPRTILFMQTLFGFYYNGDRRFAYGEEFFKKSNEKFIFEQKSKNW